MILFQQNSSIHICAKGFENECWQDVFFSILMPKNVVCFKALKQTTFSSQQIAQYLKFAEVYFKQFIAHSQDHLQYDVLQ